MLIHREQQAVLSVVNVDGQRRVHTRMPSFFNDSEPRANLQLMEPDAPVRNIPTEVE